MKIRPNNYQVHCETNHSQFRSKDIVSTLLCFCQLLSESEINLGWPRLGDGKWQLQLLKQTIANEWWLGQQAQSGHHHARPNCQLLQSHLQQSHKYKISDQTDGQSLELRLNNNYDDLHLNGIRLVMMM